jgi:putative DNA primase/helicase
MNNTGEIIQLRAKKQSELAQSENADIVAFNMAGFFCIDPISEIYYKKDKDKDVWHQIPKLKAEVLIEESLRLYSGPYSSSYLSGVIRLVRSRRMGAEWTIASHLIPMENGIFSLKKSELLPYREEYHFTWCLPYSHEPDATCPKIDKWLSIVTGQDDDLVWFLLCWMAAVLTGRHDLQKFVMVHGPGGTGKGTILRLITKLIGDHNVVASTLRKTQQSPYETANFYTKRLVIFSDAEDYAGDVSVLKAMTGGDLLPYERKYKDAEQPFLYQGTVMIASNHPIKSSDKSSALSRRMISIVFNQVVSEKEKTENQNFEDELISELPGLFNKLVQISPDEVTRAIRKLAPSILETKLDAEMEANSILAWAHEWLVRCEDGQSETRIGSAPLSGTYATTSYLYGSYLIFCDSQGRKPVGLVNFSEYVIDNCISRGVNTEKIKTKAGMILEGLRLRTKEDKCDYLFI